MTHSGGAGAYSFSFAALRAASAFRASSSSSISAISFAAFLLLVLIGMFAERGERGSTSCRCSLASAIVFAERIHEMSRKVASSPGQSMLSG